jgi:hypothetical protein
MQEITFLITFSSIPLFFAGFHPSAAGRGGVEI